MQLSALIASLNDLLHPEKFHDYAPNGLQVEGRPEVRRIVTGVSANLDLIRAAREQGADAILVHHGWFWKREDPRIIGVRRRRIGEILDGDMSLIAYHLPLDDNAQLGNNVLLGNALGFIPDGRFGEDNLGWIGQTEEAMVASSLARRVERILGRKPLLVGPDDKFVSRVAWCTGAAQDMLEDAAAAGADCFLSGEISERTTAIAAELGIPYLSCGHHATETFGIKALGEWVAKTHGLEVTFVDVPNPV